MSWFREAKFGLFIHWGVYAVPAGTYNGKQIKGIGEWIMHHGKIPMDEYQAYASEFNPVQYNPDEWVRLAKEAGMKYIVITSKHHDGFALFDSKVSKWDVVDATPYGKDLIAPLAAACKKHDLKLGLYYSQAQDWNQGGATGGNWDPAQEHDMDDYIENVAVPQVKEIMSNYGPIAVLWWDTPKNMNPERAGKLIPLLKLQPGIIHNNRLGGGYEGDIKTPEQHIPGTGLPGDWESCMTMNRTWGYKSYDDDWKSTEMLIRNLVDIASKGGNYLLNVGPTAEGLIPQPSIERLKKIGIWMKVNGSSIYGTTASPCRRPKWGRITTDVQGGTTMLYLHVFDWPEDGNLFVPINNEVESCYLLADESRTFAPEVGENGTTIKLTGTAPDAICSVVALKISGQPAVTAADQIQQSKDGTVALKAARAAILVGHGHSAEYEAAKDCIGSWTSDRVSVEWTFTIRTPGTFSVAAQMAAQKESALKVTLAGQSRDIKVPSTGDYSKFTQIELGMFKIEKAGEYTISFTPKKGSWNPVNLRSVLLSPEE